MNYHNTKSNEGFTLIEALLYLSIVAILLISIAVSIFVLSQTKTKNISLIEVEQQGQRIMQTMIQSVHNASSISEPLPGASSGNLILVMDDISKNPTVFNSDTAFHITEGADPSFNLTNSNVQISDLSFVNISRLNTPGIVKIQFTLSYVNSDGRNEYSFSKTFYSSVSIRK